MLQSELEQRFDIEKMAVPQELLDICVPEEQVDFLMDELAQKYLTIESVEDLIIDRDIVTLSIVGELKQQEQYVQISVGKGYYEKQVEENLLGMKKGENRSFYKNGKMFTATVESVKRRMVPHLTNDIVKKEGIEGICNLEEYKNYIFEKLASQVREENIYEIGKLAKEELIKRSQIRLEETDVHFVYDETIQEIKQMQEESGNSFDECVAEIAEMIFEEPAPKDSDKFLYDWSILKIKIILLGEDYTRRHGFQLNKDTYQKFIHAKAIREKKEPEQLEQNISFLDYLEDKYTLFLEKEIEEFFHRHINFHTPHMQEKLK